MWVQRKLLISGLFSATGCAVECPDEFLLDGTYVVEDESGFPAASPVGLEGKLSAGNLSLEVAGATGVWDVTLALPERVTNEPTSGERGEGSCKQDPAAVEEVSLQPRDGTSGDPAFVAFWESLAFVCVLRDHRLYLADRSVCSGTGEESELQAVLVVKMAEG